MVGMLRRNGGVIWLVTCIVLFCAISQAAARYIAPKEVAEAASDYVGENPVLLGALVSVAGIVCMIFVLFGCTDLCPNREVAFKDFENDDVFSADVDPPMVPSEFTMYPPMESTPDASGPIVFEPLPEPILLKRNFAQTPNTKLLRPKVALTTRDRTESEDSLDDEAYEKDDVGQKLKLHNLLVNSRNQIPRSQLQYIKELGNGWFGKVLQGEGQKILPGHRKTKVVIQMLREDSDSADQLAFLQEGTPYRDVDSPNVLRLLGQCVDTQPYLSILELCPFGDVKTYLRSHRIAVESFNEKGLLLKFACDMAAGLQALNSQGYIHRDFAARNCLLASDLSVKVGDYGLSEETFKEDYYVDSDGSSIPIRWLAPETIQVHDDGTLNLKRVTKESNVWAFGVTLWEIITFGSLPYSDLSNEHVLRLVIKERSLKPKRPDMPVSHLDRLYELMQLCWSDAPSSRPSLRELRIMMLHLMSSKMTSDTTAFEQKWNQLMPRKAPQVAKVAPQPQNPIPSIDAVVPDPLKAIQPQAPPLQAGGVQPQRPGGFDRGFAPLNPSLLGQVGSLESSELEPDLPQIHRHMQPPTTTPLNDLSLDAEFNAVMLHRDQGQGETVGAGAAAADTAKPEKKVETPANELSLAAELSQAYTPPDSETGDDVIEIHAEEEQEKRAADASEQEKSVLEQNPLSPVKKEGASEQIINSPFVEGSEMNATKEPKSSTSTLATESSTSGEFYTSTPVKAEPSSMSSSQNTDQLSSSFYQTALTTQTSTEDEPSILGQRKFAACLQTVVTSFDGDEFDPLSFSGSMSDEDVFKVSHPVIPEVKEEEEEEDESNQSNNSVKNETLKRDSAVFEEDLDETKSSPPENDQVTPPEENGHQDQDQEKAEKDTAEPNGVLASTAEKESATTNEVTATSQDEQSPSFELNDSVSKNQSVVDTSVSPLLDLTTGVEEEEKNNENNGIEKDGLTA